MSTNDQPANRRSLKLVRHRSPCKYANKVSSLPKIGHIKRSSSISGQNFSANFSNPSKEFPFSLELGRIEKDIDFSAENDSAARELLRLMVKLKPSCETKSKMQDQVRKFREIMRFPISDNQKFHKNFLNISKVPPIQKSRVYLVKKRSESELRSQFRNNILLHGKRVK